MEGSECDGGWEAIQNRYPGAMKPPAGRNADSGQPIDGPTPPGPRSTRWVAGGERARTRRKAEGRRLCPAHTWAHSGHDPARRSGGWRVHESGVHAAVDASARRRALGMRGRVYQRNHAARSTLKRAPTSAPRRRARERRRSLSRSRGVAVPRRRIVRMAGTARESQGSSVGSGRSSRERISLSGPELRLKDHIN